MSNVIIPVELRTELERRLDKPILAVLQVHGWEIYRPEGTIATDQYEHMRRGRCLLCGDHLGEDTAIVVDAQGILGIFCETQCLVDAHSISFLENLLTELVNKYTGGEDAEDQ